MPRSKRPAAPAAPDGAAAPAAHAPATPAAASLLPPLRDVVRRHGIAARRGLGQNFLFDLNLTQRIARQAGALDAVDVLEIGPGPGGLTRALLAGGARRVVAVERDKRCVAALQELVAAYPGRLTVIEADALEVDERDLVHPPAKLIANLPYNIATALLLKWLTRDARAFASYTVLLQKEVAERIVAPPGTKAYGRLSVIVQWLCEARALFDIAPSAFTPPPKVTSTVIQLTPRAAPLAPADQATLEAVTAAAFGQRRKMLRQSLKALDPGAEAMLAGLGIDPRRRGETLSIAEFCALARAFRARRATAGR
jgi:16S rRNA (adenine1518-N6/adenine1519-N6)-dimethyltransferase